MLVKNLVQHFGAVADPRCGGKIEHRLTDILVIATELSPNFGDGLGVQAATVWD